MSNSPVPDVYSVRELALATGASVAEISAWIESGAICTLPVGDGATWISGAEAVRAGREIRLGTIGLALPSEVAEQALFATKSRASRTLRGPLAVSSSMHAALVAAAVLATTLGLGQASAVSRAADVRPEKMRLVYLAVPGPGGGGGGGGLRQKAPPPRAKRQGTRSISSPMPVREAPKKPEPVERPRDPEPPKVEPEPLPEVVAPIVMAPADEEEVAGVLEEASAPEEPSRGPGEDGGVGTGTGTGIGEGDGAGVGEGSGGGDGGGPYRSTRHRSRAPVALQPGAAPRRSGGRHRRSRDGIQDSLKERS